MTAEARDAQQQLYVALQSSTALVESLRKARTGHTGGTQEMLALKPDTPVPPMRRPSQLKIKATGISDFQAHLNLINRLLNLADEEGEIVCIGTPPDADASFCGGMQMIWKRAGKEPPKVSYTTAELQDAIASRPVAVFIRLEEAPEEAPSGYLQVALSNPNVCILFRQDSSSRS